MYTITPLLGREEHFSGMLTFHGSGQHSMDLSSSFLLRMLLIHFLNHIKKSPSSLVYIVTPKNETILYNMIYINYNISIFTCITL